MDFKKILKVFMIMLSIIGGVFLIIVIIGLSLRTKSYDDYVITGMEDGVSSFSSPSYYSESVVAPELDMSLREEVGYKEDRPDRSIIKTGSMSIVVDNIDDTVDEITAIKDLLKGSFVSLNDIGKTLDRRVTINIKVEVSNFEDLYNSLRSLDGEFTYSSIYEDDVTDTVVDLQARLNNSRRVEEQYLTILEKAVNVEETLAVYKELNQVRLEIERVETQLKNIAKQTEYSHISIEISQSSAGAELKDDKWRPAGVFKDALRALVSFGETLGSLLIWIIVFIPVIAIILIPILFIQKKRKK
jgi:hypothetical protein